MSIQLVEVLFNCIAYEILFSCIYNDYAVEACSGLTTTQQSGGQLVKLHSMINLKEAQPTSSYFN